MSACNITLYWKDILSWWILLTVHWLHSHQSYFLGYILSDFGTVKPEWWMNILNGNDDVERMVFVINHDYMRSKLHLACEIVNDVYVEI